MQLVIWGLIVSQALLLVFSPLLKYTIPFNWYYRHIYHPLFKDVKRLTWKYWLVPIFYASIYGYCSVLFYVSVLPEIPKQLLDIETYFVVPALLFIPIASGLQCMLVKPASTKSSTTHEAYDYLLFFPDTMCRTCKLQKTARSKHCAICDQCTLVADHHCIWINNCIGKGNYQYFYIFLLSNSVLLSYASVRLSSILLKVYVHELLILDILVGAFAIIVTVFTYMQYALVRDGLTTNEEDKWLLVQDMMRAGKLVVTSEGNYFYRIQDTESQEYVFYSPNLYDHRVYSVGNYRTVKDHTELANIYDKGNFRANLADRIKS
ncbi:LAMI_0H16116g1_1 [Lachancea mirantina]|uniref:Palmitoyltransferase n=1 Tax=Lachancea mirantina TaxID=1230905 RepID=A0A1G4KJ41_9SACH|nr:LAMI_0H16116g1_1 [Lachancea mirantina]